jgi:hypothetical protein
MFRERKRLQLVAIVKLPKSRLRPRKRHIPCRLSSWTGETILEDNRKLPNTDSRRRRSNRKKNDWCKSSGPYQRWRWYPQPNAAVSIRCCDLHKLVPFFFSWLGGLGIGKTNPTTSRLCVSCSSAKATYLWVALYRCYIWCESRSPSSHVHFIFQFFGSFTFCPKCKTDHNKSDRDNFFYSDVPFNQDASHKGMRLSARRYP